MNFLTSATEIGQQNGFLIGLNKLSNSAQIWNYEAGDLRFGTSDETRMYINQFGRIGMGTTAPSEKLEVSSTNSDVGIRINAGSKRIARLFLSESIGATRQGYSWAFDGDENKLSLWSHGIQGDKNEELLSILANGLVGVGTANPNGNLNIHSNRGNSTVFSITHEDFDDSRFYAGIDEGNPFIDFFNKPLQIKASGQLAISIDHRNGLVGIGKENPERSLDVAGNAEISQNLGVKEDLFVFEDAEMLGTLTLGGGSTIDQILEYTGTTGSGIGNKSKDFPYPEGFNQANTRVLDLQVKFESKTWIGTGGGYVGYSGATAVSRDNSVRKITATLFENHIRIHYPARDDYQNRPFRILLLRMGVKN